MSPILLLALTYFLMAWRLYSRVSTSFGQVKSKARHATARCTRKMGKPTCYQNAP